MAASRYTQAQQRALIEAQLDGGMTARSAAEAAGRGELPGFTGVFNVSESSARSWAGRARRESRVENLGDAGVLEAAREQVRRLSTLIETALREEEAKPPGEVNIDRVRQLGKAAVSVTQAARSVNRPVPVHGKAPARGDDSDDGDDFLASLAGKI